MIVVSKIDKPMKDPKQFYCKKNDKLNVVADYENVWIVELKGNKFSINKNDVTT